MDEPELGSNLGISISILGGLTHLLDILKRSDQVDLKVRHESVIHFKMRQRGGILITGMSTHGSNVHFPIFIRYRLRIVG
jgi:hypothetical protein